MLCFNESVIILSLRLPSYQFWFMRKCFIGSIRVVDKFQILADVAVRDISCSVYYIQEHIGLLNCLLGVWYDEIVVRLFPRDFNMKITDFLML